MRAKRTFRKKPAKKPVKARKPARAASTKRPKPHDVAKGEAALHRTLLQCALSPRFDLLKNIAFGVVAGALPQPLGELADLTVEDVAARISSGELSPRALGQKGVDTLTRVFREMVTDESAAAVGNLQPSPRSKPQWMEVPVLSSVDAERRLNDGIERLKASPRFSTLRHRTLGEFWHKELPRAPFEESMSFGQLTQLKVTSLLEKRSFTPRKLFGVLNAIDQALEEE